MPVTYADVWEFWLRHREIAAAVDFITIHILPYWEDFPIPARDAARHVDAIRQQVAAAFPGREIFVGEFGWPSAGRMREGALPSPANQARTMQEVLALAKRENYRVNLIEAYDQPWKRQLEGTVGGHWGLYDAYRRQAKFAWGGAVSNHPHWRWQAAGGVGLAAVIFAAAFAGARRRAGGGARCRPVAAGRRDRVRVRSLIGWTVANVPLESLPSAIGCARSAWTARRAHCPGRCAAALASGARPPSFCADARTRRAAPARAYRLSLGAILLIALACFRCRPRSAWCSIPATAIFRSRRSPARRFRCFSWRPGSGVRSVPAAETAMAVTLAVSAVYIVCNESFANWQALWFCAGLLALALTLLQARDAPG